MRRDIEKVVNERAKSGRTWVSKTPREKRVLIGLDGDQSNDDKNSIRRRGQKLRNSRFNAVEQFLVRNVGRAWSKVFAEICESTDARTLLGREIRDRAKDMVAVECWLEGAKLMTHDWRGCPTPVRGLHVHPKTGLLQRTRP